jgi:MFS family permease
VRWPLVDLSLASNPRFSVLVVTGTISNIAYTVTIFLSTVYLQEVRGLDPLVAGLAFLGPSAGAALGGVLSGRLASNHSPVRVMGVMSVVAALAIAALAMSHAWVLYLPALTACGFSLGLVYAFTTVATQAVVRPERAGEAAGVTLTALVTMAGVGVAVSGTVLEMLTRGTSGLAGWSMGEAIDVILATLAAALLPAGAVVTLIARSPGDRCESGAHPPG